MNPFFYLQQTEWLAITHKWASHARFCDTISIETMTYFMKILLIPNDVQPQKVFTEYKKPIDFANEFVFSFARFRYLSLFILRISISFLKICRVLTFKKNTVLTIFNGSSFIYLATDSSLNFTDCISIRSGLMACDRIVLNSQVTNNFSSFNVSLNLDNAYFRTKGCIVAKWYIRP